MKLILVFLYSLCCISSAYSYANEYAKTRPTYPPMNVELLMPGDMISSYGTVYYFQAFVEGDYIQAQNIFTRKVIEFPKKNIFPEIFEYQGITAGDEAILLSHNKINGKIARVFGDGTAVLVDHKTKLFFVGNRPKKLLKQSPADYPAGVAVVDSHNFLGRAAGVYQDGFLFYNYSAFKKVGNDSLVSMDQNHTAKILVPPFDKSHYRYWVQGMAKELCRGEYVYRGETVAQFVMSQEVYKKKFSAGLLQYFTLLSARDFYDLVKHLLWQERDPTVKAERLRKRIYDTILGSL